jgi:YesN/AraC family two-component response regulator
MYSLVIIDDEVEIRDGLARFFDWETLGFSVLSTFESPLEALDYMERHHVDVALTDVRMPSMTGLEFARQIRELSLDTRIVFLSGYREFDFIKKAMEYRAVDYLLKPATAKEIDRVFSGIRREMDEEKAKLEGVSPSVSEDRQALKFKELKHYVEENYATTSLEDAADFIKMNPYYLSKYFKKMAGVGFSDFLLALRMEKAQHLILKVGLSISQIGKIVGYSNPNNFSRAFKKYFGTPPGSYSHEE